MSSGAALRSYYFIEKHFDNLILRAQVAISPAFVDNSVFFIGIAGLVVNVRGSW